MPVVILCRSIAAAETTFGGTEGPWQRIRNTITPRTNAHTNARARTNSRRTSLRSDGSRMRRRAVDFERDPKRGDRDEGVRRIHGEIDRERHVREMRREVLDHVDRVPDAERIK